MFDGICYLTYSHSSSCMNVQGELLFCRGDHWSPVDACGNGKPSGRIWNPPLRRRGRRPRRPGNAAAAAKFRRAGKARPLPFLSVQPLRNRFLNTVIGRQRYCNRRGPVQRVGLLHPDGVAQLVRRGVTAPRGQV